MRFAHLACRVLLVAVAGLVLISAGCGSKGAGKAAVKGRVTYREEPLEGGAIVFVPDEDRGNNGSLVKGTILLDGTFTLQSETAPGWYRVAIAPLPSASISLTPTPSRPYPGPPARYRNPALSGLAGEVKPGADNNFMFQLYD
jgi:hypothetical protein